MPHATRRRCCANRKVRAAIEAMEVRVLLSSITVNTFVDQIDPAGSSTVSLRDALALASAEQSETTIDLPAGNYKLTLGALQISQTASKVNVTAVNGTALVDAGGSSRVFDFGGSTTVALDGLTITGGKSDSGGGIRNAGKITLNRCTISGNTATQFGGGIYNTGELRINDSTISDNRAIAPAGANAGDGGGIDTHSHGSAVIVNSTISGNTASRLGGGCYEGFGTGTGVYLSTIANNSARYGGGLDVSSAVNTPCDCADSIISENFAGSGADVYAFQLTSLGHNLIGQTQSTGWTSSDQLGAVDARLSPLGNYGSPTQTMAPLGGSPALSAGVAGLFFEHVSTDQRGLPRPTHGAVDIGAVQSQGAPRIRVLPPKAQVFNANTVDAVVLRSFTGPADRGPFIVSVQWGDGSSDTAKTVAAPGAIGSLDHRFLMGGTRKVSLAVTDRFGDLSNAVNFNVTILPAPAVNIAVNTTNDLLHNSASGIVSLRDAIDRADHSFAPVNITFDSAMFAQPRTITLSRQLVLDENTFGPTSVSGPAAQVTISGGVSTRILRVEPGITASLSGLVLANGQSEDTILYGGGAINNAGNLTISNCILSNNSIGTTSASGIDSGGGAIQNTGALVISNSEISGNTAPGGGGIDNSGQLALTNCSIEANSTTYGDGAGIYNSGVATITGCCISDNHANVGPNESASRFGGGIDNKGTLNLVDSTIFGNTSDSYGGGIANFATAVIASSTITSNAGRLSGGIDNRTGASLTISNSIVAQNQAEGGSGIFAPDAAGTINSLGHNLISMTDGSSGWTASDLTGVFTAPLNARLSPLDFYGGPTQSIFPLTGSPAIGAGSAALLPSGLITDQRDFARVTGGVLDIGSVQLQRSGTLSITSPAAQKVIGASNTTIRLGAFSETGGSGPYHVVVNWGDGSSHADFVVNATGPIAQQHAFILPGNLSGTLVAVDGAGNISQPASFTVSVSKHAPVTIVVNSTADRLDPPGSATVTLRDAVQMADLSVGAVSIVFDPVVFARPQTIAFARSFLTLTHNQFGTISITGPKNGLILDGDGVDSLLTVDHGITAAVSGISFVGAGNSAIVNNGKLTVRHCSISHNQAPRGGGIDNAGTLTLVQSTISKNVVVPQLGPESYPGQGGGVYNSGLLSVIGCNISDNPNNQSYYPDEPYRGGAGLFNTGTLTITASVISGNAGGGVVNLYSPDYGYPGDIKIRDSQISNNKGPGIKAGKLTLSNSTISHNASGGIRAARLTMTNCSVTDNDSNYLTYGSGGGVSVVDATLTNCTISGNTKTAHGAGNGGGLYISDKASVANCTISNNSADEFGGGIFVAFDAVLFLTCSTISGNTAADAGGVYSAYDVGQTHLKLGNTIIAGNSITDGNNPDVSGAITSLGHNLIGQIGDSIGWIKSDLTGTADKLLDPKLSPLANHGGPTQTQIPLARSPALGAGSVALIPKGITTDQRGLPRIVGGTVDIGAVEVQSG